MPLDASELYPGFAPIRSIHVKQFFNLLTGIMVDQTVTLNVPAPFQLVVNGIVNMAGNAAAKVLGGSATFSIRDNADSADNLLVSNAGLVTARAGLVATAGGVTATAGNVTATAGNVVVTAGKITMGAAASQLVPGATSFSVRNNADAADNLLISDAGLVTARAGLVATAGGVLATAGNITATVGNVVVTAGKITMAAAASQLVPGATSFAIRNNADSANNLLIADSGRATFREDIVMSTAVSQLVPGATSFAVRDTSDSVNNVLVADSGVTTIRNALTVSAGNLTMTAGSLLLSTASTGIIQGPTDFRIFNNAITQANILITDAGCLKSRHVGQANTALVDGSFTLSAGWGATPTKNRGKGCYDSWGVFGVTANGAGIAANPTITVAFSTAYASAPGVLVFRMDTALPSSGANLFTYTSSTTAQFIVTFNATPTAGNEYIFGYFVFEP